MISFNNYKRICMNNMQDMILSNPITYHYIINTKNNQSNYLVFQYYY